MHLYGSSSGPRLAFVLRPGSDPNDLKLHFTGQDSIGIDWQGELKLYLSGRWVKLQQAVAYQVASNGSLVPVNWTASYTHANGSVDAGFTFGTYNTSLPLVLQIGYGPLALGGGGNTRDMDWSTYMGGAGDDEFTCVETDEDGNAYTCGHTLATDFPVDPGNAHYAPFSPNAAGYDNAVIAKFKGDTKRLEWATYYSGAVLNPAFNPEELEPRTEARKLAVYTGNAPNHEYVFVTGTTNCTDFETIARVATVFENGVAEGYLGGRSRMWVGAFRKENGIRDWATTHGQGGGEYTGREEGLAIAVDPAGKVAVGGRLYRTVDGFTAPTVFTSLTPSGAYVHSGGGAFVLSFDTDYTLRWATTIGSVNQDAAYTQLTDLRYVKDGRFLWFTGVNSGTSPTLDLVNQPGGYSGTEGSVMLGDFDMLGLTLAYCTRWGGGDDSPVSIPYGLDFDGFYVWVVGGTRRPSLSTTDAPLPSGPSTIYHNLTNASTDQNACDGFILKFDPFQYKPIYGTLIGGSEYDMLLDVGHDADNVYITGESRSSSGFATDLNSLRYFQNMNSNVNTRDAVVLAIKAGNAAPEMVWRTAFGGVKSERGWGIAASTAQPSDVYLVGAAASQATQAFPLKEFSTTSTLDYYQDINMSGAGGDWPLASWYGFENALDFENGVLGLYSPENSHQGHDGFIASFAAYHPVGIDETSQPGNREELLVTPLPSGTAWTVQFPHIGDWTLEVYDAIGNMVLSRRSNGGNMDLDLSKAASGIYMFRAINGTDALRSAKVMRP